MTVNLETYLGPQGELAALLIDHIAMDVSLTDLIVKLSDKECIALEAAIKSYAAFKADMETKKDNTPHIAEVF